MTAINSNRAIRGPVTAVPVVAGKGVRLVADTENNRWVVEADETVLWENASGSAPSALPVTLSEATSNFEIVRFYFRGWSSNACVLDKMGNQSIFMLESSWLNTSQTAAPYSFLDVLSVNGLQLSYVRGCFSQWSQTTVTEDNTQFRLFKVVGINRVASD